VGGDVDDVGSDEKEEEQVPEPDDSEQLNQEDELDDKEDEDSEWDSTVADEAAGYLQPVPPQVPPQVPECEFVWFLSLVGCPHISLCFPVTNPIFAMSLIVMLFFTFQNDLTNCIP
jgi:hypothetical protein